MSNLLAPRLRAPTAPALLALVLAALLAGPVAAELAVPPLEARVTDRADLLSPQEERALEQRLAAFEEETTHQVAVLTVESLEGEAVESYALRVAEAWQLGRADVDNGALFLVSAGDRRMRIEVGYGLEGTLPDAIASRIIRDVVAPRFRAGEMGAGIVAGTEAILGAIRGEEVPAPPARSRARRGGPRDGFSLALFCAFGGGMVGAAIGRKRRAAGAAVGAGIAAGLAYLLASSVGVSALAGFLGALFGVGGPVGGGRLGPLLLLGGMGGRGGLGGGGFGGGGFGGGGGGFGGGGASGSW